MRRSLIGGIAMLECRRRAACSGRWTVSRWLMVWVVFALFAPPGLRAQAPANTSGVKADASGSTPTELARFVPKENLICYVEFAGLDSHSEAWNNTAASKMLRDTTLGEMLGLVAGQLLDKGLALFPERKLSGAEIVTLAKHAARAGCVLAINANPKGPEPARTTFVLRGAISKEVKPIVSRLMGWMMGSEAKPKIVEKAGRSVVVVPPRGAGAATGTADLGWAWWAEKNDLVIGFGSPNTADGIIATLDGKSPSATEHIQVKQLAKPDDKFHPVLFAFADTANSPEMPENPGALLRRMSTEWGIERIDFRWGFEGDALMSVARLVAPKPRKPALAAFDGPTFEKSSLLAMPEGVESFLELSISPNRLIESFKHLSPGAEINDLIDEMVQTVRTAGQIDLQKDFLAYLGPKMVLYLGTGQSAATNDDSLESELSKGWSPIAAVTAMQSVFPKLTMVAEVTNPEAFSKGLDVVMIAVNAEMKAQAMEKLAEERAAGAQDAGGATGGNQRTRRPAGGGDRTKRRRSLHDTPAPRFTLTPTQGNVKSFVLVTHNDSPIRYGPTTFRPTVQLEGKYVAFAVDPAAARAALAAVQRKNWKPSPGLERASANLPPKLAALFVDDVTERLPSLLSSLPGTLQTMINTAIALGNGRASNGPSNTPGAVQPNRGVPLGADGAGRGRGRMSRGAGAEGALLGDDGPAIGGRRGGGGRPGMDPPRGGAAGGAPRNPAAGSTAGSSSDDSMLVFKVDSDKLPKAADLKAFLFPSTLCVAVSDKEIRLISRGAFPDLSLPNGLAPVASALPAVKELFGHITASQQEAPATQAAVGNAGGAGATAAPSGGRGAKAKGGVAADARGRRGRDESD